MSAPCSSFLLIPVGFMLYTVMSGMFSLSPLLGAPLQVGVGKDLVAVGLYGLSIAAAGPILVVLSAAVGRRKLLVGCLSLLANCNVIAVCAPASAVLLCVKVLSALLHPVLFPAAFAVAVTSVPEKCRLHAIALGALGTVAGLTLCLPLIKWIGSHFAYQTPFLACASVYSAMAFFFYYLERSAVRPPKH
jgi:predicted MFS family arabinose efflux permease